MTAKRKNPAAVTLGKRSAKARMQRISPERRSEIARNAARARWAKLNAGLPESEMLMPNIVDLIDLEVSEPTCFYTWLGQGWYQGPVSALIREGRTFHFEFFDSESDEWEEPTVMVLEDDGFYHFRDGKEHRWALLAETKTHVYLTGNFINSDGTQGVEFYIWPRAKGEQELGTDLGRKGAAPVKPKVKKASSATERSPRMRRKG